MTPTIRLIGAALCLCESVCWAIGWHGDASVWVARAVAWTALGLARKT